MKKVVKFAVVAACGLVLVVGGLVAFVEATYSVDHPQTPSPAIQASRDPAVIARGEYLGHAVAHCSSCHEPAALVEARKLDVSSPLTGGFVFDAGPFGRYTASNITPDPAALGRMTDGELARVIRHGIGPDGKLLPMMRLAVGPMSDEDLTAVVSWLRAQKPEAAAQPGPEYGFLAKALSGSFGPRGGTPPAHVAEGGVSIERGRYLADGPAMCGGCHTPVDPMAGFAPAGAPYSGVAEAEPDFTDPSMEIVAPNLTPDPKTGHMARWSEEDFLARFRKGRVHAGSKMPWEAFARLTDDDLRSIYRYLRSVPPAENDVGPSRRAR